MRSVILRRSRRIRSSRVLDKRILRRFAPQNDIVLHSVKQFENFAFRKLSKVCLKIFSMRSMKPIIARSIPRERHNTSFASFPYSQRTRTHRHRIFSSIWRSPRKSHYNSRYLNLHTLFGKSILSFSCLPFFSPFFRNGLNLSLLPVQTCSVVKRLHSPFISRTYRFYHSTTIE